MKIWRVLTRCLTASSVAWTTLAQADVLATHPYRGVTYIQRTEAIPWPVVMHIAIIDLSAPGIGFKVTPPGGTLETVRQTTVEFLNQENAQVAINAHFFLPFPFGDTDANVVGLAASEGVVYSPFEGQPIGPDYVDQIYAIIAFGPALNIDPLNSASIVHRDPSYNDNKHVLEPVKLWNAVSGSAQIITDGVKTIPTYSGPPDGLTPDGFYEDQNSWYSYPRARTAIGLSQDNGRLILFTVDEAGGSYGMTPAEVADLLMNDYGVWNALNLDGGGSTSIALQDPATHIGSIVNVSSDNPLGRETGSNLAVFAQPNCDDPQALTIAVLPTGSLLLSWPAPGRGWRLQGTANLISPNWQDVHASADRVDGWMQVVLVQDPGNKFYRLAKDCD